VQRVFRFRHKCERYIARDRNHHICAARQ
jgi:hypothetical protein